MRSTSPKGLTNRISRLPFRKRLLKLIGRVVFRCMLNCAGLLRPWSVRLLGGIVGGLFYRISRRHRNVALKNLRAAFGSEKTEDEIQKIARQVFVNFSREAFQFFHLPSLGKDQIDAMVDFEGRENLDAVLQECKGCILVTAHYGNFELLARKAVLSGYKINVVARDSDDPGITGITTLIRENGGYRVFDRDQPIIGAFRCLKNNECLGILPDQNDLDGIFVDFFGRPAATADGVAVLSLKAKAPIVPAFCPRMEDGRYKINIYPRIDFEPSGDYDKDVHDLTALVTQAIEREIRRYPAQWLWLHDRWKRSWEAQSGN